MEELKSKVENLTQSVGEYAETYFKLTTLKVTEKTTNVVSEFLAALSIFFFGIFVIFFLGFALGIWLGDLLNNPAAGYLLVAALFLIIIGITLAFRRKIVFPMIRNLIIKKVYE